jgi:hypothetical protein
MSESKSENKVLERGEAALAIAQSIHSKCTKLLGLLRADGPIKEELGKKFEPALADIVAVEIAALEPEYGGFRVNAGKCTLNEREISKLVAFVLKDIKSQLAGGRDIRPDEIRQTIEETALLFALHELRHRTQGIGDFATVKVLKAIDGRSRLASFDMQADRDAAVALAATEVGNLQSPEFHEAYQRALFHSIQYFFRIYPANSTRPDKVCRVAALMLMLVRLEIFRAVGCLTMGGPISALSVKFSEDRLGIAVFENSFGQKLLKASDGVSELPTMIANIENGDLEEALERAFRVTLAIGLN